MFDWLRALWESDTLSPHGFCLLWRPELIWTHVTTDALIGASYFSIPLVLARFVQLRRDVAFSWVFVCFALFILACGTTHFFSIWTLWRPDYGLEALVKVVTAGVSVATAALLWPLLPKALALPSPAQLRLVNSELEARIAERDAALAALERETAERLNAEAMFHQAQKMEAVGRLAGGVAHDFNSLLMVVLGNLERVGRQIESGDGDPHKAISNARMAAEQAASLTRRLLAFGRAQALDPQVTALNPLIETTVDLYRSLLGQQITVTLALDPTPCPCLIDANQFASALVNLMTNAQQAMPNGGEITVSTRPIVLEGSALGLKDGPYVTVEVADTGEGMTEEVRGRALEPFFTTKPVGEGTGLGLSQVFGFVKQSGGELQIESAPGAGTRIRLLFPVVGDTGGA